MELFNTIIGVLALIISIVALAHSIYYNLVRLKLSNCIASRVDQDYCWLYEFEIANLSNVSVTIKSIEIFDKQGNLLTDNGFNPYELYESKDTYNPRDIFSLPSLPARIAIQGYDSAPFKHDTEVFPASKESFGYYLDNEPAIIKITTDKRIHKFRKSQSFFPHFDYDG